MQLPYVPVNVGENNKYVWSEKLMEWYLVLLFLTIIIGAVFACHIFNRRLFFLMRTAEEEVRYRCRQRAQMEIETILDSFGTPQNNRSISKEILTSMANIMEVPVGTLRADDKFCDLCLVRFSPKVSHKPSSLAAFSSDLMDYISQTLTEEQYIFFLSNLGVSNLSEDAIWCAISERPLSDVIHLMVEAKMEPKRDNP